MNLAFLFLFFYFFNSNTFDYPHTHALLTPTPTHYTPTPAFAEDLSSGLEPHGLADLDAVPGQELREDAPEGSKHGKTCRSCWFRDWWLRLLGFMIVASVEPKLRPIKSSSIDPF
jgi:hypothetical protein